MTPARILVVEDDRVVAMDIQHQLTRIGHTVVGVTPLGEDVVRLALESRPDLVLMDIRLEGALDGVDAAQQIRDRCQVPVVFLTAYADDETLQRARVAEPFGYLLKPFEDAHLRTIIEMALYKHSAERQLRESERRYAVTLASIGDAVIATDDQARVTFLNPVAEVLTGWPQAEATGRLLADVFHIINEETRRPIDDPAAKVLRLGNVVGLANHTVLLARDGRAVPIDDCGAPIIDDRGRITGVVLVFRDATLRRQAEEAAALRLANARVDLAVRGSNIGIWEIDMPDGDYRHGRWHYVNIWEQLGYERPDSPTDYETSVVLVHPDDRAPLEAAIGRYLAGETIAFEVEIRVRHNDGSQRWILTRGVAVRDAAGKPIRLVGSYVDITELKQTEDRLRRSESLLAEAQQIDHIGCWSWDLRSGRLDWSDELYRVFGRDRERQSPSHDGFLASLHPEDRARISDVIDDACRGTRTFDCEYRVIHPDRAVRMVHARGKVIRNEAGEAIELIGTAHDITERHRAEEAPARARSGSAAPSRTRPSASHSVTSKATSSASTRGFAASSAIRPRSWLEKTTTIQRIPMIC